jgi:hypothetical protein
MWSTMEPAMQFESTLPVSLGQLEDVKREPLAPPMRKWLSESFVRRY